VKQWVFSCCVPPTSPRESVWRTSVDVCLLCASRLAQHAFSPLATHLLLICPHLSLMYCASNLSKCVCRSVTVTAM
jgi:hypothetical protein